MPSRFLLPVRHTRQRLIVSARPCVTCITRECGDHIAMTFRSDDLLFHDTTSYITILPLLICQHSWRRYMPFQKNTNMDSASLSSICYRVEAMFLSDLFRSTPPYTFCSDLAAGAEARRLPRSSRMAAAYPHTTRGVFPQQYQDTAQSDLAFFRCPICR